MATVHDVAAYILDKTGPITAMKLQKLVYYSQAWSLVWDEAPLFPERIEAWAHGPVAPDLYERHKGRFELARWEHGDLAALTYDELDTIDRVLEFYGDKSAQWLSDLTHREDPWREARRGLPNLERGSNEITHDSMFEYYHGL